MTGPIDPIRRAANARRALAAPKDSDRHEADGEEVVFVRDEQETPADPPPQPRPRGPFAAFAAQVMGQPGQKRGLRGGQEVLDAARSTYLGTEYSGPADRRPKAGLIKKTEI